MDHLEHMEFGLVDRLDCPCCGTAAPPPFFSIPYDAHPLSDYLEQFYGGKLDTSPLSKRTYQLASCTGCGLVYQTQVPNERYLQHIYEAVALAELGSVAAARGLAVRQAYSTCVEQAIQYLGGDPLRVRVLDHGSGTGLWLQMAAAYGCSTAGTEFSRPALDRLERAGHDVFQPEALPPESFDFINSEQVVEHLVEPSSSLVQLVRALRPGGLVRISVPNGTNVRSLLKIGDWDAPKGSPRSLNAVAPLEHLNCFNPESLRRLAILAGLEDFRFPLRQCIQPSSRIRSAAGALRARLQTQVGTLQWFRKPD